jgi:anti-sigma regulatory factor (Ser/Thr protein kinase)
VRVFPGVLEQVGEARAWVRLLAEGRPVDASEAELLSGELFANAVLHSASGGPGGVVLVAVTAGLVVHVHDQGSRGVPGQAVGGVRSGWDESESGRGLLIVEAMASGHGVGPANRCEAAGPADAVLAVGGRCSWARPLSAVPSGGLRSVPGGGAASAHAEAALCDGSASGLGERQ